MWGIILLNHKLVIEISLIFGVKHITKIWTDTEDLHPYEQRIKINKNIYDLSIQNSLHYFVYYFLYQIFLEFFFLEFFLIEFFNEIYLN